MNWKKLRREAAIFKSQIGLVTSGKRPPKPLMKAKVTLTRFSSIRPDHDGLVSSFKHILDGLVEAGILHDDNYDTIGVPTYLWDKAPPGKGKIRVEVVEVF